MIANAIYFCLILLYLYWYKYLRLCNNTYEVFRILARYKCPYELKTSACTKMFTKNAVTQYYKFRKVIIIIVIMSQQYAIIWHTSFLWCLVTHVYVYKYTNNTWLGIFITLTSECKCNDIIILYDVFILRVKNRLRYINFDAPR